jgi:hypothetical protein
LASLPWQVSTPAAVAQTGVAEADGTTVTANVATSAAALSAAKDLRMIIDFMN